MARLATRISLGATSAPSDLATALINAVSSAAAVGCADAAEPSQVHTSGVATLQAVYVFARELNSKKLNRVRLAFAAAAFAVVLAAAAKKAT